MAKDAKPVEFYDERERRSKSNWHYNNAGKRRGASLSKAVSNDYEAELLKRGVKDSNGDHKPIERKASDPHKQQPLAHTRLLNVGDDDQNVKTGFAFK